MTFVEYCLRKSLRVFGKLSMKWCTTVHETWRDQSRGSRGEMAGNMGIDLTLSSALKLGRNYFISKHTGRTICTVCCSLWSDDPAWRTSRRLYSVWNRSPKPGPVPVRKCVDLESNQTMMECHVPCPCDHAWTSIWMRGCNQYTRIVFYNKISFFASVQGAWWSSPLHVTWNENEASEPTV